MNSVSSPNRSSFHPNRAARRASQSCASRSCASRSCASQSRRSRARHQASRALAATSACLAASLVGAHADGKSNGVRLADASTAKQPQSGPLVQLLQPSFSSTLRGDDVPIVVKVTGRKYAPKTLQLFVDGLNASNGEITLDSSPTVELNWNTTLFPDGIHRLTVRVTDVQGFIGQAETQVFINNKGQVDTSAPVLSWLNINDGDRVKGEVSIQLGASDNFGVKYIFASINPAITPTRKPPLRQWLVNRPPYAFLFDSTKVPDGVYVLDAIAWDALENEGHAPTRIFGVLNNSLNATLLNDLEKFNAGGAARMAGALPQVPENDPRLAAAEPKGAQNKAGNGTNAPTLARSGGSSAGNPAGRVKTLPAMPAQPGTAEMPDKGTRIVEMPVRPVPAQQSFAPGDEALTALLPERSGRTAVARSEKIVAERRAPQLIASLPSAQQRASVERVSVAPDGAPHQIEGALPSIAVSDISAAAQSTVEIDRTHRAAAQRATAPKATAPDAPRLVRAEAIAEVPRTRVSETMQASAAPQDVPSAVATRSTPIAAAQSPFSARFTAPVAAPRYAAKTDDVEKPVLNATQPAVSLSLGTFATAPTQRTAPVAAPKTTEHARATLPDSTERLARASLEAPRPAQASPAETRLEAAPSLSLAPQNTAVARVAAPRIAVSNPMRSALNLHSFARTAASTSKTSPAVNFVSVAVPSTHASAVPSGVRATAQRVTMPVFPRVNENKIAPMPIRAGKTAPVKSATNRVAALPKMPAAPRNQRNAITVAPSRGAKALPASYVAPSQTFLSAIAAQHGVSLEILAAVNNLKPNAKIARGQEVLFPREISVRYAGKPVTGDVASLMVGSTSVTAFRFLFEQNGGTIIWDAAKGRVIAKDANREIVLTVGSKEAMVNKKAEMMEMAAFLMSGRTMVPVRFFEKTMAAHVEWEPATGRLLVSVANPVATG